MPRATQAKLPATLPTSAEARSTLRLARADRTEKATTLEGLRQRLKQAEARAKKATAELEEHERQMLDAEEGSPEELAESTEHIKAIREEDEATRAAEKLEEAIPFAKAELKQAEGRLRAARADVRAVAEGRRRS